MLCRYLIFSWGIYGDLTKRLIKSNKKADVESDVERYLGLKSYSAVIKRLKWLDLFSDKPLPPDKNNPLDYLNVLTLEKMKLKKEEKDVIIMHHEFVAKYSSNKEHITSKLVCFGISNRDTAIARTVASPAAIAVKMIFNNKISLTGVHITVKKEIYEPILSELKSLDIKFIEKVENI